MILLKILIMAQNGVNGTFWGPKIDFFKHFSKAVFLQSSDMVPVGRH